MHLDFTYNLLISKGEPYIWIYMILRNWVMNINNTTSLTMTYIRPCDDFDIGNSVIRGQNPPC